MSKVAFDLDNIDRLSVRFGLQETHPLRNDFRRKASPSFFHFPPHPPFASPLPFSVYIFRPYRSRSFLRICVQPLLQPWAQKSSIKFDSRPTMGICLLTATCSLEPRMRESGSAVLHKPIPPRCSSSETLVSTMDDLTFSSTSSYSDSPSFSKFALQTLFLPLDSYGINHPRAIVIWPVLVVDSGTNAGTFTQTTSMCANVGGEPPERSENSTPFAFLIVVQDCPSSNVTSTGADVTIRTVDT